MRCLRFCRRFAGRWWRNAAEVIDDVLLNADTTGTNGINADDGDDHVVDGWQGTIPDRFRRSAAPAAGRDNTGQSKAVGGGITAAAYLDLLKKLGKYGVNARDTVFITDVATFVEQSRHFDRRDGRQAGTAGDDSDGSASHGLRSSPDRERSDAPGRC